MKFINSKILNKLYGIVIIAGFIIAITSVWQTMDKNDASYVAMNADSTYDADTDTKTFTLDTSHFTESDNDIVFFSSHLFIKVYSNDQLLYEVTKDGGIWGRTTGSRWNFISIPESTDKITIEIKGAYDSVRDEKLSFYHGDVLELFRYFFTESIPAAGISLLIIMVGVSLICYHLFLQKNKLATQSLLHLGVFATVFGLWSVNETNALVLLTTAQPAISCIQYTLLLLLSISCLIFVKHFIDMKDTIFVKALLLAEYTALILNFILQFCDVIDMNQTLFITHIFMGISLIYVIYILIMRIVKKKADRSVKMNLVAVVILFVATSIDVFHYYINTEATDSDIWGRIGFLCFILILGTEAAHHSLELVEKGRKAKIYEELAVIDMLTGFRNKNAYLTDISEMHTFHDMTVFTFDLNDLKKCNDTKGHAEGDAYIQAATHAIQIAFGRYGTCYRIGGDEFCVLIPDSSKVPIGELIYKLELAERVYNKKHLDSFQMHIAYGYATFTSEYDNSIDDTLKRADVMMYKNKNKFKNEQENN